MLAQVTVLAVWGPLAPGPVVSGVIQLSLGILCLVVATGASRAGGNAFERRFLLLVAARYLIFALAQSLATYYLVDTRHEFTGSIADVLFHLEDVPLGIAFFLDPGTDTDRRERPRLLDL